MSLQVRKYVVQFLLLREVEVEEMDDINAVTRALTTLRPQTVDSIVYQRVMQVGEEDTTIAADWETSEHVDWGDLQHGLGLRHGAEISSNR